MKYGGGMNELPYPSDLTAAQWALIEPLLPAPKPKGRKRRVDLRKITNAILYVLKGGISWRMLPREFAPWKTVYHYFRLWRLAGLWDRIHDQLRDQVRVSKGRHICPSAGTNFADTTDKANQSAVAPAETVGTASDSDSVKSLAAQSPSEESAAVASPSASQQQAVKADATAARIEDGIEVSRALPVGASQSATPVDN